MALKQARKVLLWFHAGEITQSQVVAICDAHAAMDVRFRKVIRDADRDILENSDAVGGDVPKRYIVHARMHDLPIYTTEGVANENNTENGGAAASAVDAGKSGTGSVPATKGAKTSTVAPPPAPPAANIPSPTEPAPAVNPTAPPPAN